MSATKNKLCVCVTRRMTATENMLCVLLRICKFVLMFADVCWFV
jgi:hypothetical protein